MNHNTKKDMMDRRRFLIKSAKMSGMLAGCLAINPATTFSRPANLKITDIRGCTIAANFDYPIIKIYTNQDVYGWGEVRDAGHLGQALMYKPYLVGKDPLEIGHILESIRPLTGNGRYGGGFSAVDMALFDISGKVLGLPAYRILGTATGGNLSSRKVRDRVFAYCDTTATEDKEVYKRYMERRLAKGYQHYKMDLYSSLLRPVEGALSGGLPTQKGLEVWGEYVEMVRDTIGYKVHLGADHFGRMNVETGIGLGKIMAEPQYNLSYIEDVVSFRSQDAINIMKQITAGSPTPTLGYEDIFGLENFKPFIDENAVAIIHPDMETSGGLLESRRIADYADLFGIPTMFHCAGSPIGAISMVHCAATIRNFISQENHALEEPWWDDLVTGIEKPIIQQGGYVTVPEKPGLGVELNLEVAKKYLREDKYLAKGGFFEPTTEFDQPMTMGEALDKGYIGDYHVVGPWVHYDDKGELRNFGREKQ